MFLNFYLSFEEDIGYFIQKLGNFSPSSGHTENKTNPFWTEVKVD